MLSRLIAAFILISVSGWILTARADTAQLGGDFTLTDEYGQSFNLSQVRGKVALLFFGYTFCPDICPTELAGLKAVFNALGDDANRVQGLFVTLDPERDTPAVLKKYTGFFNPNILGLTGTPENIKEVADQYGVKYQKHTDSAGEYSLDHSADLYVINQQGQLFAIVPYGLPPAHVLEIVRNLLKEDSKNS